MSETTVRIQDDLYEAVNGEWLKTAVIPDDRPTTGGFSTLAQNVEKIMMDDFKALAEGTKTTDIPEMRYAISIYKKVKDEERRNREGLSPVLPVLEKSGALSEEQEREWNNLRLSELKKTITVDSERAIICEETTAISAVSIAIPLPYVQNPTVFGGIRQYSYQENKRTKKKGGEM